MVKVWFGLLGFSLINFRIGMGVNSDQIDIFEKLEEEKSDEEITDLELDVKIENSDEQGNIKTEVFEEKNYSR